MRHTKTDYPIGASFVPVNEVETEFSDTLYLNRRVIAWMPLPQPYRKE